MFERYTEHTRRVLFFSRYEASLFGSAKITPEHVLLGLLRENGAAADILARARIAADDLRQNVERATEKFEPLPASVEIPFTAEVQHVLHSAAVESDLLHHTHIGTEHLLLGLLHTGSSLAASLLFSRGLSTERVRTMITERVAVPEPTAASSRDLPSIHQLRSQVAELAAMADEEGRVKLLASIQLGLTALNDRLIEAASRPPHASTERDPPEL